MVRQIVLNFDATSYDAFDSVQEFFAHRARCLKDENGRTVKLMVQAMQMDMSPSQFSQKLNESNNTSLTLREAELHTEEWNDVEWIHYLVNKHIVKKKRNRETLLKLKAEIEEQLKDAP